MITHEQAREAARRHASAPKQPGIAVAACAVCGQNAGAHVRVTGPLVPFCGEHMPRTTKGDHGTLVLVEDGQ
ncbi:hypothetical protein GS896_27585 [Rhodococcus hoagii]|nr:hypothetical protein [Prescottella equi]MBM4654015.1 hypothetical protein [Prescottella equi]MBM4719722.1 hypothetical protein [Prescottella equi]NKR23519.1 hypothetical protein [Prescottella equi]NKT56327.1 hypothetical protein [Prescottella equi]